MIKFLEEQTKKTKQKSELQKMKTEQKKVEQSKQSTLMKEINNDVDVMLLLTPKYYELMWRLDKKKCKKESCLELAPLSKLLYKYYLQHQKNFNQS